MRTSTRPHPPVAPGTFANGVPYVRWGTGGRTLLFLLGGPGSTPPSARSLRWFGQMYRPFVDAGYSVYILARRRNMPHGTTVADMADDVAAVIRDEFGGRVDVVVGLSYGGLIAQYLAADHPTRARVVVLIGAGCQLTDWVKGADHRMAVAASRRDAAGVGSAVAEYLVASPRLGWFRRLVAPLLGRAVMGEMVKDVPPSDLLVEDDAETAFDARAVVPRITAPVLMVVGDRDRAFPPPAVALTASLIPNCTVVTRAGRGHLGTAMSARTPRDVLAFLRQRSRVASADVPVVGSG